MNAPDDDAQTNPFSTRFIRPGALRYLFGEGESIDTVLDRLRACGWQGQIVGPHGSGKSTLVAELVRTLEATERPVRLQLSLHDGQRRLPRSAWREIRNVRSGMICVDGYEQLSHLARWRLRSACRRRGVGLIVTAHHDCGLPTIWRVNVDPQTAMRIVRQLLNGRKMPIDEGWLAARLAAANGDLRDLLFELYDLYEAQRDEVG